jgi:hypothetical protein
MLPPTILHPIAVIIFGGFVTSTLLDTYSRRWQTHGWGAPMRAILEDGREQTYDDVEDPYHRLFGSACGERGSTWRQTMTKKVMQILLAGSAAIALADALARGPEGSKHGGSVAAAGDLGFELAAHGNTATLYVEDHGKPISAQGISGKLTVLKGAEKAKRSSSRRAATSSRRKASSSPPEPRPSRP